MIERDVDKFIMDGVQLNIVDKVSREELPKKADKVEDIDPINSHLAEVDGDIIDLTTNLNGLSGVVSEKAKIYFKDYSMVVPGNSAVQTPAISGYTAIGSKVQLANLDITTQIARSNNCIVRNRTANELTVNVTVFYVSNDLIFELL